ncbi:MAG: hypothetical protein SF051_15800 [Elusimicrobiota bacterium]|nr:hypothetical protein [Elusimicrobiota bacterium]
MRLLLLLLAASAQAGPVGRSGPVAAPTGFPGAFVGSVALSLQSQPLYGSMLLDSMDLHLRSVAVMRSPAAVKDYLVTAVAGTVAEPRDAAARLRESLGREPMPAPRAAALLLANALARPDQFEEIAHGLETQRAGLGRHMARLLAEARGEGDRRLIARLNAVGSSLKPRSETSIYDRAGQLQSLFDGSPAFGLADAGGVVAVPEGYTGYGPDGRPRRSGLSPAPKLDILVP